MNFRSMFLSAIALLLASCDNMLDTNILSNKGEAFSDLVINVSTAPMTKDLITSTYFPTESQIGVFVTNSTGGDYDGHSYNNILYTADGSDANQTWNGSTIELSMNEGKCYAYYPYSSSVTDMTNIPVSTTGQVDYMYAAPVTVNASNKNAALTMNHALSAVRFMIKKGTYTGAGQVTAVSVKSSALGTSGYLNAKTGQLSSVSGTGSEISVSKNLTLSDVTQDVDVIVVPTETAADLTLSVTLDGKAYSTMVSAAEVTKACCNKYTLTVNQGELSLSGVEIGDWGYDESGDPTITAGSYKVTFAGDYEEIAFSNKVSGAQVIIKAINFDGHEVNAVSVSSGAICSQSVSSNTRVIRLSNITSDVTVTFNGISIIPEKSKGVFIEGIDGQLFLVNQWSSDFQPNSIVVMTENTKFRIAITEPSMMMMSSGWYDPVYNYLPLLELEAAKKDYNSVSNTNALLRMQSSTSYATGYCTNFTFPDGKTKGLVPAFGWVWETHLYEEEINQALTLIGGTLLKSDEAYWSSSYFGKDDYAPQQYPRLWRLKLFQSDSSYEANWSAITAGAMRDYHYIRAYAEYYAN